MPGGTEKNYHISIAMFWVNTWRSELTGEMCLNFVKQDWEAIQWVPRNMLTEEMCLIALKQDREAINWVPRDMLNQDMFKILIEDLPYSYMCLWVPFIPTHEMRISIVSKCWWAIIYMPANELTEEMCIIALKQDFNAISFIHNDKITDTMINIIMENIPSGCHIACLQYISADKISDAMYMSFIEKNYSILRYVPEDRLTEEMCIAALTKCWRAIEWVPKSKRTRRIYESTLLVEQFTAALQQNFWTIQWIPKEMLTLEMSLIAVKQCRKNIIEIPLEMRTPEFYTIALNQNALNISDIPRKIITEEMYLIAIKKCWRAICNTPHKIITEEMCFIALEQSWKAIRYVPEPMLMQMWTFIIQGNTIAIQHMPDRILNDDALYLQLVDLDFSMAGCAATAVPTVFYDKYIKAIWTEYDEPRAMREIIKRCLAPPTLC
jgi:hypothetical protein